MANGLLTLPRRNYNDLAKSKFDLFHGNFGGFNALQSPDNILQGGGKDAEVETPDCLNVYSWPVGSITSLFGHARVNGSNQITQGGSAKAITGIFYLGEISSVLAVIAGNKFYEDVNGVPTDRTSTLTITSDQDNLVDAAFLTNLAMFTDRLRDAPWKWTGSGSNIALLGGSPPSGKYCVAFKRRAWILNTSANPEYGYFSALDNAESWDTTLNLLSFETKDGSVITSATVIGESLYVGKEGPNANSGHVFRVYATGGDPPFTFEEIPTGGIGPISQQATKAMPNQSLVFLGKDGNTYMIVGNVFVPDGIGKNIKPELITNYKQSRFQYSSMGILRDRNLLGLTLTTTATSTTNDRTWWYNYVSSNPLKQRNHWFPSSLAVNAFGERVSSGAYQLITGDYSGYYSQQRSGNSFAGSAFNKYRISPWHHLWDPFTVKLVELIYFVFETLGNYNVSFQYRTDFNLDWAPATAVLVNTSGGSTLGSLVLGTDVLGGKQGKEAVVTLWAQARRIQFRVQNTSADQPFNIFAYGILYRPLRRSLYV